MILTAIPIEYLEVRAHLCELVEEEYQGRLYERGQFICSDGVWSVGIREIGKGNPQAALETDWAIRWFKPSVLLFVGVAGGLKDVALCDVVVASKVYGYEPGKSREEGIFDSRPAVDKPSPRLVERARMEAKKDDWLKRLNCSFDTPPRVHVEPIAAGEKVVTSSDSSVVKLILANFSDAVAVEMEGGGFLQAAYANPSINALIVRGISDLLDDKSKTDGSGYQVRAAKAASAFAFEIISKLERQESRGIGPRRTTTRSQNSAKLAIQTNQEIGQYVLVISGTVDEINRERVEAIVAHLREISKDVHLTLIDIQEGSVKLLLKGTREGFERIESLLKSKKLSEELEVEVNDLRWIVASSIEVSDLQWIVTTTQGKSDHKDVESASQPLSEASIVATSTSFDYRELIGCRVGNYVIDDYIEAGGQAVVYTAHIPQYLGKYALKIFGLKQSDPRSLDVGESEAKKLASVRHTSVVRFYMPDVAELDFKGTTRPVLYLPMDYANLGNCASNPPFRDRLSILDFKSMVGLLDGLQAIHKNQIIHEDIKPANILQFEERIDDEDVIVLRITDFGIAKFHSALRDSPTDLPGLTLPFMSPEQPDHIHNEKGDIYSMGATLFYMITGELPIKAAGNQFTIEAWQDAHQTQPRPNAMKHSLYCPPRLALLIMRMMSVNPNDRPDLEECKRELRRIIMANDRKSLHRLEVPDKLRAELDRDEFPIRYVPEDFRGIFKPKIHEICGTELFIIRIKMGYSVYSQYRGIIEFLVNRLSDCFCLYETWGTYDINILLWGKYDQEEIRNLKRSLEERLAGSSVQIRTAIKVHEFHCDNPDIPKDADPVYALAVQEGIRLPGFNPTEYLCNEFLEDVKEDSIQAFIYVAPVELTMDRFIRNVIIRNVYEKLSELIERDKLSGTQRFHRMSMIELAPPDPSLSGSDTAALVVSCVASRYKYLADVPTEIVGKIGDNAMRATIFVGSGRVIIESDKILF